MLSISLRISGSIKRYYGLTEIGTIALRRCVENNYATENNKFYDKYRAMVPFTNEWGSINLRLMYLNPKERVLYRRYMKLSHEHDDSMTKQDLQLAYGTIIKHIDGWWD
jgi:hypothetical protein